MPSPPKGITFTDDVSIVLCGEAGKGIQTIEHLLTRMLKRDGFHVFATKEYESRVRGGSNSTQIRVAGRRVMAFLERIDILIPLDAGAIPHLEDRLSERTLIIGDGAQLRTDRRLIEAPLTAWAGDLGGALYLNTVAVGLLAGLFSLDEELITGILGKFFSGKGEEVVRKNAAALLKGYAEGKKLVDDGLLKMAIPRSPEVKGEALLGGSEAVACGALAGGCNFACAYPMSPGTGVLTHLAGLSNDLGIVVEQVEDEIGVINMALGAWYAGARALVTTSGGGFALMAEGMSLAGVMEMPVVVHDAQRPGPATGLPTRTEQGDLDLALYIGHGDFPRVVLAPGSIRQAYYLARRAFAQADAFQVPVILLTDQFLVDSFCNTPRILVEPLVPPHALVEAGEGYQRYVDTPGGVSPRGVPGWGSAFVPADSHEHDEAGHITEDPVIRKKMTDKRMRKYEALWKDSLPPDLLGPQDFKTLVVAWGSPYFAVREALDRIGSRTTAFLHFQQVWPLHPGAEALLRKARTLIVVENNVTGQFARLLRGHWGIDAQHKVLRYDGRPFSVEMLEAALAPLVR